MIIIHIIQRQAADLAPIFGKLTCTEAGEQALKLPQWLVLLWNNSKKRQ